jgi:hypothetical protein
LFHRIENHVIRCRFPTVLFVLRTCKQASVEWVFFLVETLSCNSVVVSISFELRHFRASPGVTWFFFSFIFPFIIHLFHLHKKSSLIVFDFTSGKEKNRSLPARCHLCHLLTSNCPAKEPSQRLFKDLPLATANGRK